MGYVIGMELADHQMLIHPTSKIEIYLETCHPVIMAGMVKTIVGEDLGMSENDFDSMFDEEMNSKKDDNPSHE